MPPPEVEEGDDDEIQLTWLEGIDVLGKKFYPKTRFGTILSFFLLLFLLAYFLGFFFVTYFQPPFEYTSVRATKEKPFVISIGCVAINPNSVSSVNTICQVYHIVS